MAHGVWFCHCRTTSGAADTAALHPPDGRIRIPQQSQIKNSALSWNLTTIATFRSCFREKFGVPRQSGYVRYSRGIIKLSDTINTTSLRDIEQFSHLWILFVFHELLSRKHPGFQTAVKVPALEGERKVGVFATRAPHRPNRIGLTVCKIIRISGGSVFVEGGDLVDGTPLIDIKPYHPADSVTTARYPSWIKPCSQVITQVDLDPCVVNSL
uniref:Nef-associated protein 1 n=2 Tax=Lygus hesperus TaxID=30085 RepID=A0A146KKV9_LYGHE